MTRVTEAHRSCGRHVGLDKGSLLMEVRIAPVLTLLASPTAVRRGRATGSRPPERSRRVGYGEVVDRRTRERHSRTTRRFPHRTGPLAKLDVVGLLHAMLEREAGEGFFRRVAAEPRPLLFGDPESGFYARFPLRRV
jgi:hypothetical protein